MRLLKRLFADFPVESQLASAHLLAATCHSELGELQDAVLHYRQALIAESRFPNSHPGTDLDFPWFIVTNQMADLYDEALGLLERANMAFPIQRFKAACVRALIAESRGQLAQARHHAADAVEAAHARQSAFQFHRHLGLFDGSYQPILKRMQRIAGEEVCGGAARFAAADGLTTLRRLSGGDGEVRSRLDGAPSKINAARDRRSRMVTASLWSVIGSEAK
ncbi:MAG: hypothetical protein ABI885_04605 [Gammaproteobacteria bacterium]